MEVKQRHLFFSTLKGLFQEMKIFFGGPSKWHAQLVFLLTSLKTLTNSTDCSVSRIRIYFPSVLLFHLSIFRLTEHFSAAVGTARVTGGFLKAETSFLKRVTDLLKGYSELVKHRSIEADRKLILNFSRRKDSRKLRKPLELVQEVPYWSVLRTFIKILISGRYSFKQQYNVNRSQWNTIF